jgi:hypothetical protein
MNTNAPSEPIVPEVPEEDADTRELLAAMIRMERMVREENRRWGLPLIVWKDGRIQEIPA